METSSPPTEMAIADGWRLELSDAGLQLSKTGEQTVEVPRAKVLSLVERIWLDFFDRPAFAVLVPKRRVYRLSPEQAAVFKAWLGDDYGPELQTQLKTRMALAVPLGVFFIITDPRGVLSWILGGVLLTEGLLRWRRPSHWLFLFEVAFWAGLLVRNVWQVIKSAGAGSTGGLLVAVAFALLSLMFLSLSLRMFRIFHRALRQR
jgi:hypothetical protein